MIERARVLRRLSNLVQDELVGSQRNSTVGQYHLDTKLSGYTFLEVHNQLKELKSHDPIVKSMITTLILITQDKKNIFANHENVGKIQAMIENIIKKDAVAGEKLRQEVAEKKEEILKSLRSLADDMFKVMESLAEKRATIVQNNNIIKFNAAEQKGMLEHLNRINLRKNNNIAMCEKFNKNFKNQAGNVRDEISRFTDFKKLIE